MAYTHDLGSCAERRGGPTPLLGTPENFLENILV